MILRKVLYQRVGHIQEILKNMVESLWILIGRGTGLKKKKTVKFPYKKVEHSARFRGMPCLVVDSAGKILCDGCGVCVNNCPTQCLSLKAGGQGEVKEFELKLLECVFCGYCVELCPHAALKFSDVSDMAAPASRTWTFQIRDLVNWQYDRQR